MKGIYSHSWLQSFFEASLPSSDAIHEGLLKHSFEVEDVRKTDTGDVVYEIDVLSNRSVDCLAHYGIAKEISAIFSLSLKQRYFTDVFSFQSDALYIHTGMCDRYAILKIEDFSLSETPPEIRQRLESIGQQCIAPLVDLSNYLLYEIGQPTHIFDARKVSGIFSVRQAHADERLVLLGGEEVRLREEDLVIADAADDHAIALAGVKGGEETKVDSDTTDVYVEIASFDAASVRRTMRRVGQVSRAAQQFSQGFPSEMVDYTARRVAEVFGAYGSIVSSFDHRQEPMRKPRSVSLTVSGVNALLGTEYPSDWVQGALDRFGLSYKFHKDKKMFVVSIPPERPDLSDEHDLIEEVSRLIGYDTVPSISPSSISYSVLPVLRDMIMRFFGTLVLSDDAVYRKQVSVLQALRSIGFSEIITSSFHMKGEVCVAYPVAKDKGCLRPILRQGMEESLARNAYNGELLGLGAVRLAEIGSVFTENGEEIRLALGVRETLGRSKVDVRAVEEQVKQMLTIPGSFENGVWEVPLADVSVRAVVDDVSAIAAVQYVPPSKYPFILRDVAVFVPDGTNVEQTERLLREIGGAYLRQVNLFDTFEKGSRVSYAFRLVFQSDDTTLDDEVVNQQMEEVYTALRSAGYEVR